MLLCVPNFSTSDHDVVRSILEAATKASSDAAVLDVHSDPDHGRTVVTMAADPDVLVVAVAAMCLTAAELIDMRSHEGVHPCTGAADVVPFVPVDGTVMAQAVEAAHRLAERLQGADISHHLYGAAALEQRELPDVRRALAASEGPDFVGGRASAGVSIIGARHPLVAFNVNLDSPDPGPARRIAARMRDPEIRALGFRLVTRGITQVSMNLISPGSSTMPVAFAKVTKEALSEGIPIAGSEVVGLATRASTGGKAATAYGLDEEPKILEDLIDALASGREAAV